MPSSSITHFINCPTITISYALFEKTRYMPRLRHLENSVIPLLDTKEKQYTTEVMNNTHGSLIQSRHFATSVNLSGTFLLQSRAPTELTTPISSLLIGPISSSPILCSTVRGPPLSPEQMWMKVTKKTTSAPPPRRGMFLKKFLELWWMVSKNIYSWNRWMVAFQSLLGRRFWRCSQLRFKSLAKYLPRHILGTLPCFGTSPWAQMTFSVAR